MIFVRPHVLTTAALTFWGIATISGLAPKTAHAQLVQYAFPGTPGSLAATTVASNVTAGNVNFTGSGASQFSFTDNLVVNVATGANSAATALSTNSYFQFTLAPNTGFQLNLTNLTFVASGGNAPNSSGFLIRSSIDNFATDIPGSANTIPTQYTAFTNYNISLTGSSFQNVATPTTFRVYNYLTSGTNPATVYDNLTVNGAVVGVSAGAPEPGTLSLVGMGLAGGLGMVGTVKRRKAKATQSA